MSLTSYRAAPPRGEAGDGMSIERGCGGGGVEGLAATSSSAPWGAVPSALRVFTAEFGMGSGAWPLAVATRLAKPPVLPVAEPAPWACPTDLIRGAGRGPPGWSSLHEAPRAQRTVLAEWSPGGPSRHRL